MFVCFLLVMLKGRYQTWTSEQVKAVRVLRAEINYICNFSGQIHHPYQELCILLLNNMIRPSTDPLHVY